MDENVVEFRKENLDISCAVCGSPCSEGEKGVVCPRCKTVHHLQCWIDNGGCARKGCRQLVSRELLPKKNEEPISVSKLPAWVYIGVAVLVVALAVGMVYNARKSAAIRAQTISVMVPATVDQTVWESLVDAYRPRLTDGKELELTFVPELVPTFETSQASGAGYYDQKLLVQMAAKDAPELILLKPDRVQIYVEQGALTPLNDVVAQLGLSADSERMRRARANGSTYAIPHPYRHEYLAVPIVAKNQQDAKNFLTYILSELSRRSETR